MRELLLRKILTPALFPLAPAEGGEGRGEGAPVAEGLSPVTIRVG